MFQELSYQTQSRLSGVQQKTQIKSLTRTYYTIFMLSVQVLCHFHFVPISFSSSALSRRDRSAVSGTLFWLGLRTVFLVGDTEEYWGIRTDWRGAGEISTESLDQRTSAQTHAEIRKVERNAWGNGPMINIYLGRFNKIIEW